MTGSRETVLRVNYRRDSLSTVKKIGERQGHYSSYDTGSVSEYLCIRCADHCHSLAVPDEFGESVSR